ncbi:MAG: hypothetical protein IVW57_07580 [Ktedonobacterales bacterium]|nr:hypothetical protein [Ktedonobacterales bacterium]
MAVQRKRDPDLEALILQAAAEIRRANPSIGASSAPTTDVATEEAVAAIDAVDTALARLWDSSEGEQVRQIGYSAAQAVDEDRDA